MKTKRITIPNEYTNTLRGFVDWFNDEYEPTEKDHQVALKRLAEKLSKSGKSIRITDWEIWLLENYLQSAWQDDSCKVNKDDLHKLFNYVMEKDNEQTNQ